MTIFLCIACLVLGFILGRIYGWMKYHYPEFQEEIKLRTSEKRARRMQYEYEVERMRGRISRSLDRQIGGGGKPW